MLCPSATGGLGAMVFGGGAIDPIDPKDPKTDRGIGPVPTDPAKETLTLNEDTLWSGLPVDGNNLQAKNYLPQIRQAVLEQKDYHLADKLCQKMQGLFAEAFQVVGSLHVDCTHAGAVTEYRRELDLQPPWRRRATKSAMLPSSVRRSRRLLIRRLSCAFRRANRVS